jgi:hypothetical protein
MEKKRSGPTDYPREKPKNPKGRSVEPPCLATRKSNHGKMIPSTEFLRKMQKREKPRSYHLSKLTNAPQQPPK